MEINVIAFYTSVMGNPKKKDTTMNKISIIKEIRELQNQLSYSKNIGFFFGAGTSTALGIPNIAQLTTKVEDALENGEKGHFIKVKEDLKSTLDKDDINIEDILNHIRRIREITGEKKDKEYLEIDGESAKKLDIEICKNIYKILSEKEKEAMENLARYTCPPIFVADYPRLLLPGENELYP